MGEADGKIIGIFFSIAAILSRMPDALEERKNKISVLFHQTFDFVARPIFTASFRGYLLYIDGMSDTERVEKSLVSPLLSASIPHPPTLQALQEALPFSGKIQEIPEEEGIRSVAAGDCVLLCEESYFQFSVRKGNSRSVSEPPTGSVIKGPREGFVEDVKTNMTLIRRKLRSADLVFEKLTMGRYSETTVVLCYLHGVAPQEILGKIKKRLASVTIDGIVDSSYIGKILEEYPYSVFKQIGNSEKVDVIAGKLLDGRAVILVDGSPIVLSVPFILMEDFEDSQDRYKRSARVTFLRLIRIMAVAFALLLPGIFVALQSHQYQILPLQLMITILNSTNGIPFNPTLEMIIALGLFEILSEASIRMPRHVSMALSVVGAIVLGQTAVDAGFLSSITVLIVAMSGIGIYAVPDQVGVISTLRVLFVLAGGLLGIFGMLLLAIALTAYLTELSFFNVPYLSPFAPMDPSDLKNALLKESLTDRYKRPFVYPLRNKTRLKNRRQIF